MDEPMTYYIDLITRYFSGEASPEEVMSLSDWINENGENRKLFEDYGKAWNLTEQTVISQKIDLDAEWSALAGRVNLDEDRPMPRVVSISAGETQARRSGKAWFKLAAALLILIMSASVAYYLFRGTGREVVTAENGILEIRLPDGSEVSLNQGSKLEYPSKFAGNRMVHLEGEAYFKVVHDPGKPFIVEGNNANVEVLGTMFNVNTRNQQGNMEVMLTSGKVSLYFGSRPGEKVYLNPGEQAEISSRNQTIRKTPAPDPNYMAWKTKHIVFDNVRLEEIIETLRSVYHIEIRLAEPGLRECRVTATFDQQPVSAVLKVIGSTLDLRVEESGRAFILTGNPCK